MKYRIVFDTSSDKHSSERRYTRVEHDRLAMKITLLQSSGYIIHSVSIDFS